MAYATEQTKGSVDGWWQVGLGLKATFHDQRFLTFRRVPYVKIKDTDDVLPVKEDPATPVMVIIPLYFARCTLPMHRNQQMKSSIHSTIFDIPMHPVREDQRHRRRFAH